MTEPAPALSLLQPSVSGARHHASEQEYKAWIDRYVPGRAGRWERMRVYHRFIERWPCLEDWFTAPLSARLGFDHASGQQRTAAQQAGPYLMYLSLVQRVPLDFDYLLGRKFAYIFRPEGPADGYGIDTTRFDTWVERLVELGYPRQGAGRNLTWSLGRLVLHRGDPDLIAITVEDLHALGAAVRAFGDRDDFDKLRDALWATRARPHRGGRSFVRNSLAHLHTAHVILHSVGQVSAPARAGTKAHYPTWWDHLLPEPCPGQIRAVLEQYLRLRLDAQLDRPDTVRLTREALRRFVNWLHAHHAEVINLAQLNRTIIEEYLRWLPTYVSDLTGRTLSVTTRKHEINMLAGFFRDTAVWEWSDVPGRPLLTHRDAPRKPEPLPRFIPAHELDSLMTAVGELDDPLQRAALLVLRWSGARRDEVRRLATDCLDAYPDGHPRLRIPVGKGHDERAIPLHVEAAAALQDAITNAAVQNAPPKLDRATNQPVQYVFVRKGRLLSESTLFDDPLRKVCRKVGLVDTSGRATVSPHRFRHTLGTQLADGGARIQTIMAILGHKSANMAVIYSRIADAEVRRQYESALTSGRRLAGPAAEAVLNNQLDDTTVHWLKTNFLKTELEIGHCLRLPDEGPCECELMLTCPKFLTTEEYAPRLRARRERERQLIEDARSRGWAKEEERHTATRRRLTGLLEDLGQADEDGEAL